ncbi:MAG: hypothetical protein LAP87_24380 [Acidobacteriia bacterium]|nr:hypothetical protein [Terriglobia bacterium]
MLAYLGLWQLGGIGSRTVEFEIERWENNSWGMHNIVRDQISGTIAVYADGSRENNVKARHYGHYFIPSGTSAAHSIYLRPGNIAYELDDTKKTATLWRCTCTWEEASGPQLEDQECKTVASTTLGLRTRLRAGIVAGVPVIW